MRGAEKPETEKKKTEKRRGAKKTEEEEDATEKEKRLRWRCGNGLSTQGGGGAKKMASQKVN